jgi:hypothetical protein
MVLPSATLGITNSTFGFYFLTRSRFFTISPALRDKNPKPPPSGEWLFVGTFNEKDPLFDVTLDELKKYIQVSDNDTT